MLVLAYRHYMCLVVCYHIHAMEIAHVTPDQSYPTVLDVFPLHLIPFGLTKCEKVLAIEQMDCLMNPSLLTFTSFKLNSRILLVTNSNHLLGGKWSLA